ncbi:uncharacterized protein LOC135683068 [Rhopilema esculentum]|uniref:uncharacterized protein LOC135683068 n=1 Tax=Rhopilema esculentum TaxID=499914 RepID=UPI0031D403F7|eukprot:gene15190-6387_t
MPTGHGKSRTSANAPDSTGISVNEKILRECHELYVDKTSPERGLVYIADTVGISLLAPRKKITVMLMGNHSAGKSSFINWYVEEHIQKTGVAIETQGFTFITSGKKRESLTGNATFHLFPHFKPLQEIEGVRDYVSTEISTSKQKKFNLVMFVDTPGLVDGDMLYPFDVNKSIEWLGGLCDLIFCFFDPIGQALCKRTLNIVERLNEHDSDKIRFFLSKADTAGTESDRQRVLMQITQELCKRPGLNKCGFDMPTIYIPSLTDRPRCENNIDAVCKAIEKTINQTIQNTLNTLEKDCFAITSKINEIVEADTRAWEHNVKTKLFSWFFSLLSFVLALFAAFSFLADTRKFDNPLQPYLDHIDKFWSSIPASYHYRGKVGIAIFAFLLFLISRFWSRSKSRLSRRQKRRLEEQKSYVMSHVKPKKEKLYAEYLKQSVADHDL